jgi:hypothetical protein
LGWVLKPGRVIARQMWQKGSITRGDLWAHLKRDDIKAR